MPLLPECLSWILVISSSANPVPRTSLRARVPYPLQSLVSGTSQHLVLPGVLATGSTIDMDELHTGFCWLARMYICIVLDPSCAEPTVDDSVRRHADQSQVLPGTACR